MSDPTPVDQGNLTGQGFVLVQIAAPTTNQASSGTVVVDIRRPGSVGGSLRAARASIDYDPANGRHVRCAHITMPHNDAEDFIIYLEDFLGNTPQISILKLTIT